MNQRVRFFNCNRNNAPFVKAVRCFALHADDEKVGQVHGKLESQRSEQTRVAASN